MNGFKAARLRANMTQEVAAEALGVSQPTLCNWETGKFAPRLSMVSTIAQIYGCEIADLFKDYEEEDRQGA